ncbi:MAG: signal peptidase II [Phycisphaerales bacterium]
MDQPANAPTSGTPTTESKTAAAVAIAGKRPACILLFVIVTLAVAAADLGLKYYAFHKVAGEPVVLDLSAPPYFGVPHHDPTVLIPGVLNLQLTANEGAIFGIGKGSRWVFIVVGIVAIGFVGRIFWRSDAKLTLFHIALALILAGAVGNLYDRAFYGVVRDMLHMFPDSELPFGLSWPGGGRGLYPWIFNLADVALLFGVITVVLVTWRHAPPSNSSTVKDA